MALSVTVEPNTIKYSCVKESIKAFLSLFLSTLPFCLRETRKNKQLSKNSFESTADGPMDALGLLRIHVRRGINLAVRDTRSSDPYVVIEYGSSKVKTRVEKDNCNPVWDEDLTICVKDLNVPITLSVYDKDTFTGDDSMGSVHIDIKPYLECRKMGLQGLPDGTTVRRVEPSRENCLAGESCVVWNKGKMIQDMILGLRDAECGEVHVAIEWIDLPGGRVVL